MDEHPQSQVILTEKIKRWIRTILTTANLPPETREELIKYTGNRRSSDDRKTRLIPFELVKTVHKYLQAESGGLYLHELLEGSDVQLHQVTPPTRNPELEERIQRLKAEQANREYVQMTKNVGNTQETFTGAVNIGKEVQSINKHLISVLNFVLTVGGAFLFGYKAVEYSLSVPNFAMQLLTGLIIATVVFFADLYFLIKYDA